MFSDPEEGALKYRGPDGCMQEIVDVGRYKLRERSPKARIVHLALKVDDLEKATNFYKTVFGFKQLHDYQAWPSHVAPPDRRQPRHRADEVGPATTTPPGRPAPARASTTGASKSPTAKPSAKSPRSTAREILSKPGAPTLRFRAPDRTIVEVVEPGRYETPARRPHKAHA